MSTVFEIVFSSHFKMTRTKKQFTREIRLLHGGSFGPLRWRIHWLLQPFNQFTHYDREESPAPTKFPLNHLSREATLCHLFEALLYFRPSVLTQWLWFKLWFQSVIFPTVLNLHEPEFRLEKWKNIFAKATGLLIPAASGTVHLTLQWESVPI